MTAGIGSSLKVYGEFVKSLYLEVLLDANLVGFDHLGCLAEALRRFMKESIYSPSQPLRGMTKQYSPTP